MQPDMQNRSVGPAPVRQTVSVERIGGYVVEAKLGEGGMGTVYLACSRGGRAVAVKVAKPELASDPEFRARFRAEVTAARAVGGFHTAPARRPDPRDTSPALTMRHELSIWRSASPEPTRYSPSRGVAVRCRSGVFRLSGWHGHRTGSASMKREGGGSRIARAPCDPDIPIAIAVCAVNRVMIAVTAPVKAE